ncbi:DUF5597 domain-containing protein [Paenibacillus sp. GCM10027626]|uniref:DUF5597 domain-containing protein n=1 Tax=Paenibacillus sp. GCM10027626 TaxID=3273411 RepID=UPI0036397392
MAIPMLVKENGIFNLYVDDKPYIALAGELHNSSASDLGYMSSKVWPYLRELHLNTVILPVYWELIEPSRDEFDFRLLDGLVEQARREGFRLVLLWFGLWKNAGLIIEVTEDEFIVAGVSFEFEFLLKRGAPGKLGMIRAEEGSFSENQWIRGRVLNGDQSAYNLKIGRKPAAMRVEVYCYQ